MTKVGPLARGHRARGALRSAIAIAALAGALAPALAGITACANSRAASSGEAFIFPFGDSLWKFTGAAGAPVRLARQQGASFARCWDGSSEKGGALFAADTRGGRMLSLKADEAPRLLYSGAWSWAGAGAGMAAAASREYREGFEFRVISRASAPSGGPGDHAPSGEIQGGIRLDCFVSDALFLPGKVVVAGAKGDGSSFSVWELKPVTSSDIGPLISLPRNGGFLRLAGNADGELYCFVSASSSDTAGPLSIWRLPSSVSASGAAARPIEPRFSSAGARAWFGSGWLDGMGRLAMPLSLGGDKYALSLIDPGTGTEKARLALPAPVYQRLGSAKGIDYAMLYDHAKEPGRFRFAAIDTAKSGIAVYDMP